MERSYGVIVEQVREWAPIRVTMRGKTRPGAISASGTRMGKFRRQFDLLQRDCVLPDKSGFVGFCPKYC